MKAMDTKSELALNALNYVIKQSAMGNMKIPLALGINEQQINELLTLNNQEIHDMASTANIHLLNITFDSEALGIALKINDEKSARRQEIFKMLKAGASYPVMNTLYGLTTENIGFYRKTVQLTPEESQGGRPVNATDAQKDEIRLLMKDIENVYDPKLPSLLLEAHKETQLKVSTIWRIVEEEWQIKKQISKTT